MILSIFDFVTYNFFWNFEILRFSRTCPNSSMDGCYWFTVYGRRWLDVRRALGGCWDGVHWEGVPRVFRGCSEDILTS